jgi:hypothetical protein
MRGGFRRGVEPRGGVHGYPLRALYQEVAFVAYHFHWPAAEIMNLEHAQRRRWVEEISSINQQMNERVGESS